MTILLDRLIAEEVMNRITEGNSETPLFRLIAEKNQLLCFKCQSRSLRTGWNFVTYRWGMGCSKGLLPITDRLEDCPNFMLEIGE